MKLTVTNKTGRSYGVNAIIDGYPQVVELAHNETWEGDFDDNEATALSKRDGWKVEGYAEPKGSGKPDVSQTQDAINELKSDRDDLAAFKAGLGPIANRLGIHDSDEFAPRVTGALDDGEKAKQSLTEIAELFGTSDVDELNVKAAVEKLLQAQRDHQQQGGTDLAAAVALLDDKNDEHWTDAGKPSIEALKTLTGGNVTRAQVDALPTQRERAK